MERGYRDSAGTYDQGDGGGGGAPGKRTRTQELPAGMRTQFESSLGADLSGVRLHTGDDSAQAAADLGARAFTTGNDIHFGAGQFQPDDPYGLHLIAHEVAHTQQPASAAPRLKGEGDAAAGNADEAAADHAADAMVAGKPAAAGFVPFKPDGTWSADEVLAGLGDVPDAMRKAILDGVRMTALFCIDLRSAVSLAGADPAKLKDCERIAASLTSRINELTYATSRSPLTYAQLREVAGWAVQFGMAGDAAGKQGADAPASPAAGGDAIEARAAKIAADNSPYAHEGKKDVERRHVKGVGANSKTAGESLDPPLADHDFIHDPFDNTVTVVRRLEGTGIQYTYDAVKTDDGVKLTLVRTEELSKLRVGALAEMDKAGMGKEQETAGQRDARLARDRANEKLQRDEWAKQHPTEAAEYQKKMEAWQALPEADRKKTPMPPPPAGYPPNIVFTLCPSWCPAPYEAGGGKGNGKLVKFPFTPPTSDPAFRTLEQQPDGPRPGDVYWVNFSKGGSTAHMGVFKSRSPAAGFEGQEMWVVTDGGQGGYTQIQMVVERTKGPFDPRTGYFGDTADSGQKSSKRYLVGWIDIDAFNKNNGGEEDTVST